MLFAGNKRFLIPDSGDDVNNVAQSAQKSVLSPRQWQKTKAFDKTAKNVLGQYWVWHCLSKHIMLWLDAYEMERDVIQWIRYIDVFKSILRYLREVRCHMTRYSIENI